MYRKRLPGCEQQRNSGVLVKIYSKNRRIVKIIPTYERSLHTLLTKDCYKLHFFISFADGEKAILPMKREV